uniref:Conserved hypothetical plastid protein n=1 Tax=Mastocarpus papillatus TaxID=31436 RepID=A0A342RZN2_9FLOR|nr:conserved hypothetical plastid protein [Mastocarpus papillatus]AOL58178.1 conserved hypothetical plastid protein [Mastocarpus papillatus]
MVSKLWLKNMEGNWLSHKTIYYLETKKINVHKVQKEISKIQHLSSLNDRYICKYKNLPNNDIIYDFVPTNNQESTFGIIRKIYNHYTQEYKFQTKSTNNLKIKYIKKKIIYTEYIYSINANFRISITIIKKCGKYIAICFNSEIKITQNL